jgi:hypothetical protein
LCLVRRGRSHRQWLSAEEEPPNGFQLLPSSLCCCLDHLQREVELDGSGDNSNIIAAVYASSTTTAPATARKEA